MIIKASPYTSLEIPNQDEVRKVIDKIDLSHLINFIISLSKESWVPNCYWKGDFERGDMFWAIFSYLATYKIILIEDKYFKENPEIQGHREKYVKRDSYHNGYQISIYKPILDRLVEERWLDKSDEYRYKLGVKHVRNVRLDELGI